MTLVLQFFLSMIEHPEVMAKAQKEIDSVVGNDRLPTFADRKNLPYIEAVFNECLRHGVAVPLCTSSLPDLVILVIRLPSLVSPATQTDGRRYLRGDVHPERVPRLCKRVVRLRLRLAVHPLRFSVTNRNILRGDAMFTDPHTFDPERFLVPVDEDTAKCRDPKNYCFGFGRRVRPPYLYNRMSR